MWCFFVGAVINWIRILLFIVTVSFSYRYLRLSFRWHMNKIAATLQENMINMATLLKLLIRNLCRYYGSTRYNTIINQLRVVFQRYVQRYFKLSCYC